MFYTADRTFYVVVIRAIGGNGIVFYKINHNKELWFNNEFQFFIDKFRISVDFISH